ncbi:hypothetical protein ABT040_33960 [Streptomyces sp. NPDC002688]|uniref:hypothetical protein n=1 Tax=Streptomyces sp. NPDC002688 TaxID=3154423 RepID=UPI00331A982E
MQAPPFPFSRHHTGDADIDVERDGPDAGTPSAAPPPAPWRRRGRRIAADLLPPVLTRAVHNARASRRATAQQPGGPR